MDYVQARKLIDTGDARRSSVESARADRARGSDVKLQIAPGFALAAALGPKGRLATGDPEYVPVGKYARSALTSLGVWNQVADRLVRADNVRAALAFVSRGEAPLGIVYTTDALVDKGVRVVDTFPESSHPRIVYPVRHERAREGAKRFSSLCASPARRTRSTSTASSLCHEARPRRARPRTAAPTISSVRSAEAERVRDGAEFAFDACARRAPARSRESVTRASRARGRAASDESVTIPPAESSAGPAQHSERAVVRQSGPRRDPGRPSGDGRFRSGQKRCQDVVREPCLDDSSRLIAMLRRR